MNIITGSGRSGTSFVAKLIYQLDQKGVSDGLIWENDIRAGLEDKLIVDANKQLFAWNNKKRPYSIEWLTLYEQAYARQQMAEKGDIDLLNKLYDKTWVKDPLFSKTLKIWLDSGLKVDHLVLCTRNPHTSMISAKRVNRGFEPADCYSESEIEHEMNSRQGYLWDIILRYGLPFLIVRYEHMVEDLPIVLNNLFPDQGQPALLKLVQKEWDPKL